MKLFFLFVAFSAILVFVVWVTIKVDDWKKGITGGRNTGKTATNDIIELQKTYLGKGVHKYSNLVFSYKGNEYWLFETKNVRGVFPEVILFRVLDMIDKIPAPAEDKAGYFWKKVKMKDDSVSDEVELLRLKYHGEIETKHYYKTSVGVEQSEKMYTLIIL